jgi:lipid-A-disaccharide synthase
VEREGRGGFKVKPRRFVLVAGEASGDLLGAGLIEALRVRFPAAEFAGVGGPHMIAAGLDAWYPAARLSVMGLVEVVRHLPDLLRVRADVARRSIAWQPDAFVGIDAPDFNLGLERRLRRAGLATVHYVSPSVWAWRERRAARIGHSADRVLCLFPMEPPIYARHGVDARFVGHPLADCFPLEPDQAAARNALGLHGEARILALLPGSRLGEIRRLGADFLAAAALLRREFADLQVIAPMASPAGRAAFEALVAAQPSGERLAPEALHIIDGNAHAAMVAADAVLLASGTAALEAMLAKRAMVVAYRLHPLTYRLVRALGLLKVARYSLPNVLAGRELVTECMQDECTPDALADALRGLLERRGPGAAIAAEYGRLHDLLRHDADRSAAAAIAELVDSGRRDSLPSAQRNR